MQYRNRILYALRNLSNGILKHYVEQIRNKFRFNLRFFDRDVSEM